MPNPYVGCVIYDEENGEIISTGYHRKFGENHAERNAILNYRGSNKDLEGAKLYVDLFPCNECAKEIIQSGIKEVYYLDDKYAHTNGTIASKRLFDKCGVKYIQLSK